jgi:hypothetical protein
MTGERLRTAGLATMLILIGLLAIGCATTRSATDTVGGWFGRTPIGGPASGVRPRAFYASSAGVKIYESPDAASKIVGELARHEGLLRFQVQDGFAYVTTAKGSRAGWVLERALIAELPASPAAPAAPASTPDAEPDSAPERPEEPSVPPEKSVFDPY